ncbi:kinase-like domain-containing protein, partial [Chytridium lagenaria]
MEAHRIRQKYSWLYSSTPHPYGRVETGKLLGRGTYGSVYKGRLLDTGEEVAIKVVRLREATMQDILLEVDILRSCRHSKVTAFKGLFLDQLELWICMELCESGTLFDICGAVRKPLTEDQIACLLRESLIGLEYLHTSLCVIHRDFKAGNLLLTDEGDLKIADFGVSARLKAPLARTRTFIGTPNYMAPEVIRCDPDLDKTTFLPSYDVKADIWAVGVTAIELAEGRPPFYDLHPTETLRILLHTPQKLALAQPQAWTPDFVNFIHTCLEIDPAGRPSCERLLKHPFLAR